MPYAALVAAVDLAASVNAGVTVAIALQGADLNGIACKDGVCTAGLPTC